MKKINFLICTISLLFSSSSLGYTYEIAIAAIFNNEAPYLKEWIEFHKLIGVDHFFLYNNLSTDNYQEVLQSYIEHKEVELIEWPYSTTDGIWKEWLTVQVGAYNDALQRSQNSVKWLITVDIDEFVFPATNNNLKNFLKDYEEFGGICVNWQLYGTSFVQEIPSNKLLIEMLTLKAKTDYHMNKLVKSIVRPERVSGYENASVAYYKDGYFQVTPKKDRFTGFYAPYVDIEKIRINHYWTRDEKYFHDVKIARRLQHGFDIKVIMDRYKDLNIIEDLSIFRFISSLKKKLF